MVKVRKLNYPKYVYLKFVTQAKKTLLELLMQLFKFYFTFWNWKESKVQCDYDNKLFLLK
jgi:hypothetical protein